MKRFQGYALKNGYDFKTYETSSLKLQEKELLPVASLIDNYKTICKVCRLSFLYHK